MLATQQFLAVDQHERMEMIVQHGQVECAPVGKFPLLRLSESSANLLSPTCSQQELADYCPVCLCSPQIGRQENELDLVGFQVVGQGMRPTSSASLTCNSYVSPSSGDSTPISSAADTEADSASDYNATGALITDDSTSAPKVKPSACNNNALSGLSPDSCSDSNGTHGGSSPLVEGMAPAGDEDDGPHYLPGEMHPFDLQLARMLAAVSQAASASPAQLLQLLLNFAAEDYQDLVNALVESGSSCVHLLACHLHNLRTMAEEAINDSSPAATTTTNAAAVTANADGADDKDAADGAATSSVKAPQKGASERGPGGRKGRASTQAAVAQARDVGPEDKIAQESLRASILDQYRRVVYRLVDTALGLLNTDAGHPPAALQPPPLPTGRGGGGAGAASSGRNRAERQLGRSMSVPISGSAAAGSGMPTPAAVASAPPLRNGQSQKAMAPVAPASTSSVLSSSTPIPRTAGGISGAQRNTGGATGPASAFSAFAAVADAADTVLPLNGLVVGNVMQAVMMQQSAPSTAADVIEALSRQGLSGTTACSLTAPAAGPLLAGPTLSLAALGRSLSQSAVLTTAGVLPVASATGTARGRAATAESYASVGAGRGSRQLGLDIRPAGAAAVTLGPVVGANARGGAVASLPYGLQRVQPGDAATALLLQQRLHLQQQQRVQHQLQRQKLQQQQQQLQQQQLQQQLQLFELLAAANTAERRNTTHGDVPFGGMAAPSLALPRGLQVISPSDLATPSSANVLSAAAAAATAAQLIQAYDSAATLAEQGVWRPNDSLAALQWQLPTAAAVAAPFTSNIGGLVGSLSSAGCEHPSTGQQQLMMMMQSGFLPASGAGTVGTNAAAVAAAAAAVMPYGTATSFPGIQLPGGWNV